MPSKKKKYNARFPAGRIKKIMQSDEEIGKVAQAVPVIISRTLELFVESLLTKTVKITNSRNAKTLSTSHMKQCIMSEQRFDFLRELVKTIPDISVAEEAANYNEEDAQSSPEEAYPDSDTPYDLSMPSTSLRATRGSSNTQVAGTHYNGGGGASGGGAVNSSSRQHLKRGVSSVIMHTTSLLHNDGAAGRFTRSESSPAGVVPLPRQRLKHQSQSLPMHNSNNNHGGSGSSNNNNTMECSPPKRARVENVMTHTPLLAQLQQPRTAIPAPVVSFDFCNKPVVKIDYSNLPLPAASATAPAAPHSAPANMAMHPTQSAFNFSPEPVISIDLSNIVATANVAITSGAANMPANGAAAATINTNINIDALLAANRTAATPPAAHTTDNATNSKVTMAAPYNSYTSTKSASAAAKTPTATNKNSFFELDEDYDNI